MIASALTGLRARVTHAVSGNKSLIGQAGWVFASFGSQQLLRMISNIALAALLSPALLGLMLLINTLRTGGELLSDVGIGQSVVNNRRGDEPLFLDTAWTMKILRGFALFAIALLATGPVAALYDDPQLRTLLPISAIVFVISGFTSPARYVVQKQMGVRKLVLFDLGVSIFGLIVQIGLALMSPTIWALIGGLLISTAASTLGSFFLVKGMKLKLRLDRLATKEIFHFGKWIFFSSLVYFLAMNLDRLYFAGALPYAVLGVYGIARTFADVIVQVFQRMGNILIFPKISASRAMGADLRSRIAPIRWLVLLGTAVALGAIMSVADVFIDVVYDPRYHSAGIFLTILLLGTWFAALGAVADALMMGVGKPASVGSSNLAKIVFLVLTLPLLLPRYGIIAAIFAFAAAEAVRYAVLMWRTRVTGIAFSRQDIAATVVFVVAALTFREVTGLIGLTGGISGWIAELQAIHV